MTLPYIMEEKSVDEYYTDQEVISEEDIQKLHRQQSRPVVQFTVSKIEKEAKKYWDLFYKRNEDRFFKDRHWVVREFQELLNSSSEKKVLLEIGCGTGNLIYPLLEENPFLFVYACDFSSRAIDIVKRNPLYNPHRINALVADITTGEILNFIPEQTINIITLIFVLSAIDASHYDSIVKLLHSLLRPGGLILFRDYGLYDMTQLRFKQGHFISENFYMRQDGTRLVI